MAPFYEYLYKIDDGYSLLNKSKRGSFLNLFDKFVLKIAKEYFKENGILVLNNETHKSINDFVNLIYLKIMLLFVTFTSLLMLLLFL